MTTTEPVVRERIEPGWDLVDGVLVERDMGSGSDFYGRKISTALANADPDEEWALVFGPTAGYKYPALAGGKLRLPDVSIVRRHRLPDGLPRGWTEISPDLVVEVASPNDEAGDLQGKVREWLDGGAGQVWVVFPDQREVMVHRPDHTARTYVLGESVPGEEIVPGFSLALDSLFSVKMRPPNPSPTP